MLQSEPQANRFETRADSNFTTVASPVENRLFSDAYDFSTLSALRSSYLPQSELATPLEANYSRDLPRCFELPSLQISDGPELLAQRPDDASVAHPVARTGDGHHAEKAHAHKQTPAEKLAALRTDINLKIKNIDEQYSAPQDAPARIMLVAEQLARDPERWKDRFGKCNVFAEATLKAANVDLPWSEGHATAWGMAQAMVKDSQHFQVAFEPHGKTPEEKLTEFQNFKPQNGDIIVWKKGPLSSDEHIGILQGTYNGVGNIICAGSEQPSGIANTGLDYYTGSSHFGAPRYVIRRKPN